MTPRFLAGLIVAVVGLVLITTTWALAKRDTYLHVDTDTDDEDLAPRPSLPHPAQIRRAS